MDGTKLLWHMDKVIKHFDEGKKIPPIHIDVGLTKKCNMRCVYCYGNFQQMTGAVIERDALLNNLVKSAYDVGVKSLAFIGDGEPTLNPTYYEALRLGRELGLSLSTSTNGILVNDDYKRESILESCEWMRFNISAYSPEGFKKIHRSTARDIVLKNISDMVKYREEHGLECDIGLQMVFNPMLMSEEVLPLAQFALMSGVDYFVIKQCSMPTDDDSVAQFDMKLYDSKKTQELLEIVEKFSTPKTKIIPKWNLIAQKGKKFYDRCCSIPFISEISGNGDWYPCGYMFGGKPEFDKYKFGNLHKQSLKQMLDSDKYWEIIRKMREDFNVHKSCKGNCRQEKTNEFSWNYLHPPKGINFV